MYARLEYHKNTKTRNKTTNFGNIVVFKIMRVKKTKKLKGNAVLQGELPHEKQPEIPPDKINFRNK